MALAEIVVVVDGEREFEVLAILVSRILGIQVAEKNRSKWSHSHSLDIGRLPGLGKVGRRLLFEIRRAHNLEADGVVAAVDRDDGRYDHLAKLERAREYERGRGKETAEIPVAIGEAAPHFEAWLLDDPDAILTALQLPPDMPIPTVTQCQSPKKELEALVARCESNTSHYRDSFKKIAAELAPERCSCREETGFGAFEDDVRVEFRTFMEPSAA